jgi:hypothetical protein
MIPRWAYVIVFAGSEWSRLTKPSPRISIDDGRLKDDLFLAMVMTFYCDLESRVSARFVISEHEIRRTWQCEIGRSQSDASDGTRDIGVLSFCKRGSLSAVFNCARTADFR